MHKNLSRFYTLCVLSNDDIREVTILYTVIYKEPSPIINAVTQTLHFGII